MTPDELRAFTDKAIETVRRAVFIPDIREGEDLIVSEEVSIALTTLENLARLCAELEKLVADLKNALARERGAGVPLDREAYIILNHTARVALAKLAELEAQ